MAGGDCSSVTKYSRISVPHICEVELFITSKLPSLAKVTSKNSQIMSLFSDVKKQFREDFVYFGVYYKVVQSYVLGKRRILPTPTEKQPEVHEVVSKDEQTSQSSQLSQTEPAR